MTQRLYEWFGLFTLYGNDMKEYMKGYDALTRNYSGTNYYAMVALIMLVIVSASFAGYYFLLNKVGFDKRKHWLLVLFICLLINFFVAFLVAYSGTSIAKAQGLRINFTDSLDFGLSNMCWSAILFLLLSASPYPRKFSTNCGLTPWKQ